MSHEHDENQAPPLSDDAATFLAQHAETGAPTADELANTKQKLLAALPASNVVELKPRRSFLPPEALAVAALVAVAVIGQLAYMVWKGGPAEVSSDAGVGSGVAAALVAYRQGHLQEAHLAASSCTDPSCVTMASKLMRAMDLSQRFNQLDDAELDELKKLDVDLSGGEASELTRAIAEREKSISPDELANRAEAQLRADEVTEALVLARRCASTSSRCAELVRQAEAKEQEAVTRFADRIQSEKKAKNFESAALTGERCVKKFPSAAICYRLLGAVYASIAARGQDVASMEKARVAYERFLEVASPDDEYAAKVRAILESAPPQAPTPPAFEVEKATPDQLFTRAQQMVSRDVGEARMLFEEVVRRSSPGDALGISASRELTALREQAREVYLRGYQLKESNPDEAVRLFEEVVSMTPPDDDTHRKAVVRIKDLRPTPSGGNLEMRVGETTRRQIANMQRVAVGDPSVADISVVKGALSIRGASRGKTTLLVWLADGSRQDWLIIVK